MLSSINLPPSVLVTNELAANHVILPVVSKEQIRDLKRNHTIVVDGVSVNASADLSENDITVLESIWNLYTTDAEINKQARISLMGKWDNYSSLKIVHSWWNNLPYSFTITHVGKVLAHTNARRCDNRIPELPLAT